MEVVDPAAAPLGRLVSLIGARSPAVPMVVIGGEPWSGKSTLLDRAAGHAARLGWTVARARAVPPRDTLPWQLFRDAFDDLLTGRGASALAAVAPVHVPVLTELFPALSRYHRGDAMAARRIPAEGTRRTALVGPAVRDLMTALAGPRGLLLALDDGHWMDQASAELIDYLVRRPPTGRVLMLFAHRERQSPPRVLGMLAAADAARALRRIEVGPLAARDLAALLPDGLTDAQRRSLITRAGGNPGLLLALESNARAETGAASAPEPLNSQTGLLDELRALSDEGWLAARSAAVLGDGFAPAEVYRLAALPADLFAVAFGELVREDIVRRAEVLGIYRFRHPLLRTAVYRSADEGWLLRAHAAVLTERRDRTTPTSAESVHLPMLIDDPLPARTWDEESPSDWRLRIGRTLVTHGRFDEGLAVLDRISGFDNIPAALRAEAACWRARAQRMLGRHAAAEAQLTAERARLDDDADAASAARVDLARQGVTLERGCPPATLDVAEHADAILRAHALALAGACEAEHGRVAEATGHLDAATELVDAMEDGRLANCLDALFWIGSGRARLEHDGAALDMFEHGLSLAEKYELEYMVPQFCTRLAETALRLALVDRAMDAAHRAVRSAERIGGTYAAAQAFAAMARCALVAGDRATAIGAARRALECADAWYEPWADRVRLAILDIGLDTGDHELIDEAAIIGMARRSAQGLAMADLPAAGEVLSRVASVHGGLELEQPARWAEAAEQAACQMRLPGAIGLALLARAHNHLCADPLGSAALALSAAVALTRGGRKLDAARAHLVAATAWTAAADRTAARRELADARVLLDGHGAHGYLDQVDLLDATRPPSPLRSYGTGTGVGFGMSSSTSAAVTAAATAAAADDVGRLDLLSHRELEIAELVSEGYTNQQIARALTLSHKTVETYLGRIFKKLDVNSRVRVATEVKRISAEVRPLYASRA
jgi:DNA-binding CsgD family transcriptional regulator/tetratricopeptide (TPR) repeat protein